MTAFTPKITEAGLAEIVKAKENGLQITFAKIALGTAKYEATGQETGLKELKEFYKIADISKVGDNNLHMTSIADSDLSYQINEIGFYTGNQVLFALLVNNDPDPLAIKSKNEELLLAFDLVLKEIPTELINIEHHGTRLNLAMAEQLARLAKMITMQNQTIKNLQDRIIKLETRTN